MTKFKNARQQAVYEIVAREGATGKLGGVNKDAYEKGKSGIRAQWSRASMAYAAWAAGRDEARKDNQ